MFTFGIFSTHVPYIALVMFYAYFLITGVEKASKGELQSHENTFVTELSVEKHFNLNDTSGNYYHVYAENNLYAYFDTFAFKRKIKHRVIHSSLIYLSDFYNPFSNRPPPLFNA